MTLIFLNAVVLFMAIVCRRRKRKKIIMISLDFHVGEAAAVVLPCKAEYTSNRTRHGQIISLDWISFHLRRYYETGWKEEK